MCSDGVADGTRVDNAGRKVVARLVEAGFDVLAHDTSGPLNATARLQMIRILAYASGTSGMAGGQAIDLAQTREEHFDLQKRRVTRLPHLLSTRCCIPHPRRGCVLERGVLIFELGCEQRELVVLT